MSEEFKYETAIIITFGHTSNKSFSVDIEITYKVTYWGLPARINYNEHDHPAEGPEIEVVSVKVLDDSKYSKYLSKWLTDNIDDWAHKNIDTLVENASEELTEKEE